MKHAEIKQSKVHVNRSKTWTNKGFGVTPLLMPTLPSVLVGA